MPQLTFLGIGGNGKAAWKPELHHSDDGSDAMERAEFKQKLKGEGYTELFDLRMEASETGPEHSHEFDALLLVLEGEMTIACIGKPNTFRAGDLCSVPAGTLHTEQFGSGKEGVHYLAAGHYPGGAKLV